MKKDSFTILRIKELEKTDSLKKLKSLKSVVNDIEKQLSKEEIDYILTGLKSEGYSLLDFRLFEIFHYYLFKLPDFLINENIHNVIDTSYIENSEEVKLIVDIIRLRTEYHLKIIFRVMKIDIENDPNVRESEGSSTWKRLAKLWVGRYSEDPKEFLDGRFSPAPTIRSFEIEENEEQESEDCQDMIIAKKVEIHSCCSHHLAPFSSNFSDKSYAVIAYIPNGKVVGISKLQKLVNWYSRRGWLQEELTTAIFKAIKEITGSRSVYVAIKNVIHSCEAVRSMSTETPFSSCRYSGLFTKFEYRQQVENIQ